ncbi:helix-turn-helix transcriptional regulator [Nonomuraea sp. SYSU D8015]|uniref:helix-turn-helix transcriptional regulator n=1 Tax=Nonomuraea sp. SYSU D8015 TaxID=2593644 RepID=UPI0016602FBD|nr:AAA family ATPase [Nonomuraea sp. SYSU D8015]
MSPTVLRGRAEEMARALAVLRAAVRTGQGAVLLIRGEPGIGKSALAAEIGAQAARIGFLVGAGKAEESDQIAPLAPLVVALRSGPAPLLSQADFSGLVSLYDRRLWLVDRMAALLEERAMRGPVLIVVEDVQWADPLTMFALRVMPGRLTGSPVVWVLTTRSRTPLSAEEIVLRPLSQEAIEEVAVDRLGEPPDGRLRELLRGAGGNPFLAVELLDGLAAGQMDGELPAGLVLGVRGRLESLPTPALRLLQVGAVLGRSFTIEDAAALLDESPMALVEWLEAGVRGGLLDDDGLRLSFRHDLLRQAVYADVPRSARRALHAAAARHLTAVGRSALEVAPHILAGARPGDVEAVRLLRRAAAEVGSLDPTTAVALIERALDLVGQDDPGRAEVGLEAVEVLVAARQGSHAVEVADRLIAAGAGPEQVARLQVRLAGPLWEIGRVAELAERVTGALTLDGLSETLRAQLLGLRALTLSRADDLAEARRAGQHALDEGVRIGSAEAQATALWALAEIAVNEGRHSAGVRHFQDLRTLTGRSPGADEITSLLHLDDYATGGQLLIQARLENERQGGTWQVPALTWAQALHNYGLGHLDECEADLRTLLQLGEDLGEPVFHDVTCAMLARIALLRGELATAHQHLARAREQNAAMLVLTQAMTADAQRDHGTAGSILRTDFLPLLDSRFRWVERPAGLPDWPVPAARIALRSGDAELAWQLARWADEYAERNPEVATARGMAAQAMGLVTGDTDLLGTAVALLRLSPCPLWQAHAVADHGAALLQAGSAEAAIAVLDQAWDAYTALGATGEARRVQRLLQSAGVRRNHWKNASTRAVNGWEALTDAERRVAHLIAGGHSNRSAAAELMLSPNTVGTHLRSIFAKLGVNSRVQLARSVMEQERRSAPPP